MGLYMRLEPNKTYNRAMKNEVAISGAVVRVMWCVCLAYLSGCSGVHVCGGSESYEWYKTSAFKSWLLFDTVDTYYAPPRLSSAPLLMRVPPGMPQEAANSGATAQDARAGGWPIVNAESSYIKLPGRKEGAEWVSLSGYASLGIVGTPRLPENYPWEVDYSGDINQFVESLDLAELAAACYAGCRGRLYYIPGTRAERQYPALLTGGLRYITSTYVPARFATPDRLELAKLMDNIWLLYQLRRDGWVEQSRPSRKWRWSAKAVALNKAEAQQGTLRQLPPKSRDWFCVLRLIEGADEGIPPIACRETATRESVLEAENNERFFMNAGEGSHPAWSAGAPCVRHLPAKQSYLCRPERGISVSIGNHSYRAMMEDKEYTSHSSIALYELFASYGPIVDYYKEAVIFDHKKLHKRHCVLIYEH